MKAGKFPWQWVIVIMLVAAPVLAACSADIAPAPQLPPSNTPLPQVVEGYMAQLPGPGPKLFLTTRVFDRNNTLIAEFWDEGRRYWVPIDQINMAVQRATIATEDKTFYSNPGVDWAAIARAVLQNSGSGDVVSGASTITQQLARNITMPYEKRLEQSLDRKMSETLLAQELTQRFSKDDILEMYLNVVYYGHLAYGIEAAARTYFGKSAAELDLAESALLAGLPQSPGTLDPLVSANQERAKVRQGLVLALMARDGYLSADQAQAAYAEPLHFQSDQIPEQAPHFVQYVRQYLNNAYGADLVNRGGLVVHTSIDLRLQARAEQIVRQQVSLVRTRYNLSNASLVALKPDTGEVLAMVGSADYHAVDISGQVNVALSLRQPGSSIKPILYALAFTRGLSPADVIQDTPVGYPLSNGTVYRPVNYDGQFHGTVRLRQALANSFNVPAVKLLNQMGVPDMVYAGRAMGIQGLDQPAERYGLSLTLGGAEVTLLSLTNVYGTLANQGQFVPATPIHDIVDATGKTIRQYGGAAPKPVVDPRVAYMLDSVLSDNQARSWEFGPNSPLKLSRPAAAKTGTTTDFRDNWTMGYTPYLAVGVWAGNSNGQPMRNTTGLTGAAPIWHDFMEAVFADPALDGLFHPAGASNDFVRPAGLLDVPVCASPQGRAVPMGTRCSSTSNDLVLDPRQPVTLTLAVPPAATQDASTNVATSVSSPVARPTPTPNLGLASAQTVVCGTDAGGQPILALRLPDDPAQREQMLTWANQSGISVTDGPCDNRQEPAAQPVSDAPQGPVGNMPPATSAAIVSPGPGAILAGPVDVIGTAMFDTNVFQFYKVEFGRGSSPTDWVTMGSGHNAPVADGRLETWHADALPNGTYALRVVLVRRDGNYVTSAPVYVSVQH